VIALLLAAQLTVATASDFNPLDLSLETELGRLEPGDPFPDIDFTQHSEQRRLSEFEGVRVVDFWASWCEPCISAMPELDQLASDYDDRGVRVIALVLDQEARALKTLERRGLQRRTLVVGLATQQTRDRFTQVSRDQYKTSIPWVFVVDADGQLVGEHRGSEEDAVARVRALVETALNR